MNWSDLAKSLASIGLPLLGAALPIPGGAAIGSALASAIGSKSAAPEDILATLTASADAVAKAKEFEATHREKLLDMAIQYEVEMRKADSADLATVNATMQSEAVASANENWWQKGWRPFNGYVLGLASLITVCGVFVLAYLALSGKDPNALNAIPTIVTAIATVLIIPGTAVGIATWHRGKAQIAEIEASVKGQ